ncbi:hypothetical protein COOONC_11663 [Cooperia oncophora]
MDTPSVRPRQNSTEETVSRGKGGGLRDCKHYSVSTETTCSRFITQRKRHVSSHLKNIKPVLIESMTYRLGHHSTSDDSTVYRSWTDKDHPIKRFKHYITEKGWWNDEEEKKWQTDCRKRILKAFGEAEKEKWSHYHDMFEDVYRFVFFLP